jgi:predicted transcriptional regulator
MSYHSTKPTMQQKIFSMQLAVETVSLYLLCCAVADTGQPITPDALADKWNGDRASLERELIRLEERNILKRIADEGEEMQSYSIIDEKNWR